MGLRAKNSQYVRPIPFVKIYYAVRMGQSSSSSPSDLRLCSRPGISPLGEVRVLNGTPSVLFSAQSLFFFVRFLVRHPPRAAVEARKTTSAVPRQVMGRPVFECAVSCGKGAAMDPCL